MDVCLMHTSNFGRLQVIVKTIKQVEISLPLLQDDAVYYLKDLAAFFRKSKQTIARWVRSGLIPPPAKIGPYARGWRGSVVRKILDDMAPPSTFC